MDNEQIICYCSNVSKAQIIDAIRGGARTLQDIREMTSACTIGNCKVMSPKKRCCSPDIMAILDEFIPRPSAGC